jgi:choline dehydrogenase-like flavoprotein
MLVNFTNLKNNDFYDYCIVGAGPAGITLAIKLAKKNKKILLVEGGGTEISHESQSLYEGEVVGDEYLSLDTCRLRYFGGTSNHWSGVCRTFDEIDFLSRPKFHLYEWPIEKSDIDKYLTEAFNILEINNIKPDKKINNWHIKKVHFEKSPPVRFKDKYFDQIKNSNNIFLTLNTNCINFETNGKLITKVVLKNNFEKKIKSENFILSTGGIENSRILLWSNELSNGEIVKNTSSLGKYWMEHPNFDVGEAIFFGKDKFDYFNDFLVIEDQKKIDLGILNNRIRFKRSQTSLEKNILELSCYAPKLLKFLKLNREKICGSVIQAVWEQEPLKENKITLSKKLDYLGVPRTKLYWKKTENDLINVKKSLEVFASTFIRENIGRIKIYPYVNNGNFPSSDNLASSHHIGGTRMSDNPNNGVVDKNCKVHGQENLYILGSSIFPTGGYTNPTLPIIQFALRLSEHLLKKN